MRITRSRAVTALTALGLIGVGWAYRPSHSLVHELVEAGRPRRVFRPRLSVDVPYRDCTSSSSTSYECNGPSSTGRWPEELLEVTKRISERLARQTQPDALHASALATLLWGNLTTASLDRAIEFLRTANRLDHNEATLIDLSAAQLLRSQVAQNQTDLFDAMESASEVLERDSTNRAALFNLALAESRIGLRHESDARWRLVATMDRDSPWSSEELGYVSNATHTTPAERAIEVPLLIAPPEAFRAFATLHPVEADSVGWEYLLPAWAASVLEGDSVNAAAHLQAVEATGQGLSQCGADSLLYEVSHAIHAARNRSTVRELATTHSLFGEAREALDAEHRDSARALLERVGRTTAHSPALNSEIAALRGAMHTYAGQTAEGETLLREALRALPVKDSPLFVGRTQWMLATTLLREGRYEQALMAYRAAADAFERARASGLVGALQYLIGEAQLKLGDEDRGYASVSRALNTLSEQRPSVWQHNALNALAKALASDGWYRAATQVIDADIAIADSMGRPIYQVEAQLARARLALHSGHDSAAVREVDGARRLIDTFERSPRAWFTAATQQIRGEALLKTRSLDALASLDSAVGYYSEQRNALLLLPAEIARSEALLAADSVAAATRSFEAALNLLAEQRRAVEHAEFRVSLLERARRIVDQLTLLHVAANRPNLALASLEQGRASLQERSQAVRDGDVLSHAEGPQRGTAIEYASIGDTLLIWSLREHQRRFARRTVSRALFLSTLARTRMALERREAAKELEQDLSQLYLWLVAPVEQWLGPPDTPLLIVADGDIDRVPFAALRDGRNGEYLIQRHPIRFAASLRDGMAVNSRPTRVSDPVLLVADPDFETAEFPSYERLPGARAEARELAQIYRNAATLDGAAANPEDFKRLMQHARMIHFAGHAVLDERRPELSFLLLAGDEKTHGGRVTAAALANLDLEQVDLVVLSACRTLEAGRMRSGGLRGFAAALLGAGAGGVLGADWRVDDDWTRDLMVRFHRAYVRSGNPSAALRSAQLEMLALQADRRSSPAAWAGFRYMGR